MIFGRNRTGRHEQVSLPEQLLDERDLAALAAAAPSQEGERGPHDVTARPSGAGYIDLGALRVRATQGMKLRLDLEESTQRIIAVTVTTERSALQMQAFSAPRAAGLWEDLRAELLDGLAATAGATVQEQTGTFGPELLTRVPAAMPDGSPGWNVARFVGVDGPRWFVRGVFHGEAAFQPDAAESLERVFSDLVVVRGDAPMPPRELLPLRPPPNAQPVQRRRRPAEGSPDVLGSQAPQAPAPGAPADADPMPREEAIGGAPLPERGPEITETR